MTTHPHETRVRECFEEAFDLSDEDRRVFLERLENEEPVVASRVAELLGASARADSLFEGVVAIGAEVGVSAPRVPAWKDRYEIVEFVGEGAAGAVFSARQLSPPRMVAIKVLKSAVLSRRLLERFDREARILARLAHPCIATIHDAGTVMGDSGTPVRHIAMEYVAGSRSIIEHCREVNADLRTRVALLARVCEGVQHGHRLGIIHRDLKPANVLVTPEGEPKIIDFSVARLDQDDDESGAAQRTLDGQVLGSLAYMSPEQAGGRSTEIDTRSDVWSLGAILYELVEGSPRRRISGLRWPEALRLAGADDRPPFDGADWDRDLEAIADKAMAFDVTRRYQSASALERDLTCWLSGAPVSARVASRGEKVARFVRRHRLGVTLAVVALAVSLATAVTIWNLYRDSDRRGREIARRNAVLRREDYFSRTREASSALARGYVEEAADLLRECPEDLRHWEWSWLTRRTDWRPAAIAVPGARVESLLVLPNGRVILGCSDGTLHVRRADGTELETRKAASAAAVRDIAVDARGRFLCVVHDKVGMTVMDASSGRVLATRPGDFESAALSPDGETVDAICVDRIAVWHWKSGAFRQARAGVRCSSIARENGRPLFAAGNRLSYFDVEGRQPQVQSAPDCCVDAKLAIRRADVLSGSSDGWLQSYDVESLATRWKVGLGDAIVAIAASPDDRMVAVVRPRDVLLMAGDPLEVVERFGSRHDGFARACFTADSASLLTTSLSGIVERWFPDSRPDEAVRRTGTAAMRQIALSGDGERALSCNDTETCIVWSVPERAEIGRFALQPHFVHSPPELNHAGTRALFCSVTEYAVVDLESGTHERRTLPSRSMTFDTDRDLDVLATACEDGTVRFIDTRTSRETHRIDCNTVVSSLRLTPDGKTVVTSDALHGVRIWDRASGRSRSVSEVEERAAITDVLVTEDLVIGGTSGSRISVWSRTSGALLRAIDGNEGAVTSMALSGDGRRLFVHADGVRVFDMKSGATAVAIEDAPEARCMTFSPRHGVLITGHADGSVRFRR